MDLSASRFAANHFAANTFSAKPVSAPEQVLAAELQNRGQSNDALSMMVSSMVRMVQAGKSSDSRWQAS
ncbi:MAG: hypothetical protein VKK63_01875 [Synechococcus sp.]|nr:hypothetical protein [Synechococcus sp.]